MTNTNKRKNAGLEVRSYNHRTESQSKGVGRIFSVAIILLLVMSIGMIVVGINGNHHYYANNTRHTITVDGDPSDWSGTAPSTANSWVISNGEWIWKDAVGDERNDFNNSHPDNRTDLTEFRVTGDSTYIYFMAKFKDLDDGGTVHLGDNGATWMAITIDNGSAGGATWFAGQSDTNCNSSAAWEYQIVVNLADSRYSGKNMINTTQPLNESTANWGAIFYVINSTSKFQNFTGDTGQHGLMAVNLTLNTIEIKIAWSVLGLNPADSPTLNISVITARGYSDYASNTGNTWDVSDASDALDCITTTGPNTWDEVQDGVVNDYATITFSTNGDVSSGSFVPEFSMIITAVFIAIPFIFYRNRKR